MHGRVGGDTVGRDMWQGGALTQRTLTERAPGARSWGAPRARRGPGVGPTTLTAQGRQIRAPPPAHALGLASRLLITAGPLLGLTGEVIFKNIDRIIVSGGKRSDLTPA